MPYILLTLLVLNEDRSIDSKQEHPSNIKIILLTLFALNEDRFISFKGKTFFEHPANIS